MIKRKTNSIVNRDVPTSHVVPTIPFVKDPLCPVTQSTETGFLTVETTLRESIVS